MHWMPHGHCKTPVNFRKTQKANYTHTNFKEVYSCFVTPDIEIIVQEATLFEAQLGKVVSAIIPEHHQSARFQYLCTTNHA